MYVDGDLVARKTLEGFPAAEQIVEIVRVIRARRAAQDV